MPKLFTKVAQYFNNLSLKRKLLAIVMSILGLISAVSFICLHIISSAHLDLLHESIANNLTTSSATISGFLDDVEATSGIILADSTIQTNLKNASTANPRIRTTAYQSLSYSIQDYYQQSKPDYVHFITLYNPAFIIHSNYIGDSRIPAAIEQEILEAAAQGEGRPVWILDYADEYGIFLGRQIRDIQSANFDVLGTLIIAVDLNEMMLSFHQTSDTFQGTQYFLSHDNETIYNNTKLTTAISERIYDFDGHDYKILSVLGHRYFICTTDIPEQGLLYACYVSYDSIFHSITSAWILCFAIILIACLISIIFSEILIVFISRHTQLLVQKMQAFNVDESILPTTSYDYSQREDEFGLLHRQFDHMANRIRNLVQVNYINELWKKDAQLKSLEMQINPHFLYNTLDSINWRAKAHGASDISHMVKSLGSLLRVSLSKTTQPWNLEQEIATVNAYITIQKYRFEDRLAFSAVFDEQFRRIEIPKLILQPLVENAIHYGLEETTGTCDIEITVCQEQTDNILHIYVSNSGSQFEDDLLIKLRSSAIIPHGFGIGLVNIDERIRLMFGAPYGLFLYNDGNRAIAQIDIPACNMEEFRC